MISCRRESQGDRVLAHVRLQTIHIHHLHIASNPQAENFVACLQNLKRPMI
jgi:hypothetical protein